MSESIVVTVVDGKIAVLNNTPHNVIVNGQVFKGRPKVDIIARRWVDSYGNTNNHVLVYVNGELAGEKFEDGGGEYYMQIAHNILQEAGLYPKTGESLSSGADKDYYDFIMDKRKHHDCFTVYANYVQRKREL